MKTKRLIGLALILSLLLTSLVGCAGEQGTSAKEAAWTISIEGVKDEAIAFTSIDAEKIETREIQATMKKKDGSEKQQVWQGYGLKEVLDYLEAGEFSSVLVEAGDGYSKELSKDLVISEGTILGIMVDGNALEDEDNKVQLVINGQGSNWWIKGVAKIKVNK